MTIIAGKNEYVYFFVKRTMECIGTGDGSDTTFTTAHYPLADMTLDGTVGVTDVQAYVGTNRSTAVAAPLTSVTEADGTLTFTTAPTNGEKVYATYGFVYGYVTYAQEYSLTSDLETTEITPLSVSSAEVSETLWKFEGSLKVWDAHDIERDLIFGVDQTTETVGGTYAKEMNIPTTTHHMILKKMRDNTKYYRVLKNMKINSFEEGASGGELSEKSFKIVCENYINQYTPTVGSGL